MGAYDIMGLVGVIMAFFLLFRILLRVGRNARIKKVQVVEARRERIHAIFREIDECFARHGLTFEFAFVFGGYKGRTVPSASGVSILISHYLNDDYKIELVQMHDETASTFDRQARAEIHKSVVMALLYSRRAEGSNYFFRQNLPDLKEEGIEKVVTALVHVQGQYDEIWAALDHAKVREHLGMALDFHSRNVARKMELVDRIIDHFLPKPVAPEDVSADESACHLGDLLPGR